MIKRKRIVAIDLEGARQCADMAHVLRGLSRRFGAWPSLKAETVAFERSTLVPQLLQLQREAEEILLRRR